MNAQTLQQIHLTTTSKIFGRRQLLPAAHLFKKANSMSLPNPNTQREFYSDVPFKRLLAWVIDGFVTFGIAALISLFSLGLLFFVFLPVWAVFSFLYRTITISAFSATPGMMFAGIEFRMQNGHKFDFFQALLHTTGTFICWGTALQIVSILLMFIDDQRRGLVDMVLGSAALNKRAKR